MTKKIENLILIVVLLLAAFLRFWQLGQNPSSLYWDEVAIGLDGYSISQSGLDINGKHWLQPVFVSYGDFKAPVLIWLNSLSITVFGLNPFAIRLPVALFSLLSVYLIYVLCKEFIMASPKLSRYSLMPILTAFVLAISPWSTHFGRIGFESSLSMSFLLLALIFFFKALRKHAAYFLLSVFFASVAIYSYYSLRLIIPLLCASFTLIFWQKIREKKMWLFFSAILFVISMLPMLTSPYYEQSQSYRLNNNNLIHHKQAIEESSVYLERHGSSLISRIVYHRFVFVGRDFLDNFLKSFSPEFLFLRGDQNLRHHSGYLGEFFLIFLPFFYLGAFLLFKNRQSKFALFLFSLMLISPITAAMVYEVPHASRAIYLLIPFSMLIAWGLNEFVLRTKKLPQLFLCSLLLINALFYYFDYFTDYKDRSSEAWLYSYNQVASYIKENHQQFGKIEIDERYWFPQIFIYYQFPELLAEVRNSNSANNLALPSPFDYLFDESDSHKKTARFIYYEKAVKENLEVVERFNFLDGEQSLVLVVEEESKVENE